MNDHSDISPWLGPESFSEAEADRFFGRTKECSNLRRRVEQGLLTVLFGDSGLGKTSLIRAGLFPELRRRFYTPVYVRLQFDDGAPSLIDQVWERLDEIVGVEREQGDFPPSLWSWFNDRLNGLRSDSLRGSIVVLVFDQFEEVFTKGAGESRREESENFLNQLADLAENRVPEELARLLEVGGRKPAKRSKKGSLRSRYFGEDGPAIPPYRVVLSLRADYLYLFDRLASLMPSGMKRRMEIKPLARDEALLAIRSPAPHLINDEVANIIAQRLQEKTDGSLGIQLLEKGAPPMLIKPGLLSMVCDRLNQERILDKKAEISKDQIQEDFDSIFESYYDESFADLSPYTQSYVEDNLTDENGHRILLSHKALETGIGLHSLERLINSRLLQVEERATGKFVEFVHDRFATVAFQRLTDRKKAEEADARKRKNEEEEIARAEAARKATEQEEIRLRELERVRRESELEIAVVKETLLLKREELVGKQEELQKNQLLLTEKTQELMARKEDLKRAVDATNRVKQRTLLVVVVILIISSVLFWSGWQERRSLSDQSSSLQATVSDLDAKRLLLEAEIGGIKAEKANADLEVQKLKSEIADREDLKAAKRALEIERSELLTRIQSLEQTIASSIGSKPGPTEPPKVALTAQVLPDSRFVQVKKAKDLVLEFLEAGSGRGQREQWELFDDFAYYEDGRYKLPKEQIKDKIKDYRAGITSSNYWLKIPAWVIPSTDWELEIGILYGYEEVKLGEKSSGVLEAKFRINFRADNSPVIALYSSDSQSPNTGMDVFEKLFRSRSTLRYSEELSEDEELMREEWLSLITHEMYVAAGCSYSDNSNLISPDAGRWLDDQVQYLAGVVDYFEEGRISRDTVEGIVQKYNSEWTKRELKTLREPLVRYLPGESLWMVKSRLSYLYQRTDKRYLGETESEMKIRIPNEGWPEIVWIRNENDESTSRSEDIEDPNSERTKGFINRILKKEKKE